MFPGLCMMPSLRHNISRRPIGKTISSFKKASGCFQMVLFGFLTLLRIFNSVFASFNTRGPEVIVARVTQRNNSDGHSSGIKFHPSYDPSSAPESSACIQCISIVGGNKIPRPSGPFFHGKSRTTSYSSPTLRLVSLTSVNSNYSCWGKINQTTSYSFRSSIFMRRTCNKK